MNINTEPVSKSDKMPDLHKMYLRYKKDFTVRLNEFKEVWRNGSDEDIFAEFCYCLCTPREKAKIAGEAIKNLRAKNRLFKGSYRDVDAVLKMSGIALHPQKAERIIINRKIYYPGTKSILTENYFFHTDIFRARRELALKVNGFGFKEASHFLRNIGFGGKTCILDTHIAKQLIHYNVIDSKPSSWTEKNYLAVEQAMAQFARKKRIPLDVLDLVLMYNENPEIMK
jgi:N-glycosylase/DNA lyase